MRAPTFFPLMSPGRKPGLESPSAIGRGTQWSVAGEAVLKRRAAGSGAPRKGDLRLPGAAEETGAVGGKTASPAWAGTAQRSERSRNGRAGYNGARSQVLSHE